jgi:hypothetical protein
MTPLFWCFPLIVYFGMCDAIISAGEEQKAKYIPQSKGSAPNARVRDHRNATKLSATSGKY